MNQAEVIHAGWAHRDCQSLSLLDICQADTQDVLLLDMEIKAYLTGATPGAKGPSFADRAHKQHEAEVRRATSTGKEVFSSPEGLLTDAGFSLKPPSRKKKATKSKGPALPPLPQVISQSVNSPVYMAVELPCSPWCWSSFTTAAGNQSKRKSPSYLAADIPYSPWCCQYDTAADPDFSSTASISSTTFSSAVSVVRY